MDQSPKSPRAKLTAEHFEPWRYNRIDLTLTDGTHRVGMLAQVNKKDILLRSERGGVKLQDDGVVQIVDAVSIGRASRN